MKIDLDKIQDKRNLKDILARQIESLNQYIFALEKTKLDNNIYIDLYKRRDDLRYLHKKVNKAYSIEQNNEK